MPCLAQCLVLHACLVLHLYLVLTYALFSTMPVLHGAFFFPNEETIQRELP